MNNMKDFILHNGVKAPALAFGTWLIKHEFGHVIQSRILGWLYIPIIVIPSYIWYQCSKLNNLPDWLATYKYYQFYTEWWANQLIAS